MEVRWLCLLMFALSGAVFAEPDCPLQGNWQSHKAKTLESMRLHGTVNERQRTVFEGDYFGKLTVRATCTHFTMLLNGKSETRSYETVSVTGNEVITRYYDPWEQKTVETTVVIESGCYSVPIEGLGFREYFCRVE